MTIEDIFDEAYEDTNTSKANYSYEKALRKFNAMYKELYRMIVTTQEDYFWTYWNTDIQEWAREYKVEREQTQYVDGEGNIVYVPWIAKIKRVSLIDSEGNIEILKELSSLEEESGVKWYTLKDNHIFLNRTPTEDITAWLQVEGIEAILDVALTDTDDVIFPWHEDLKDFANVLEWGLKAELREHKQDFDKSDRCRNLYEQRKEEMKRYISQRVQCIYYSNIQY